MESSINYDGGVIIRLDGKEIEEAIKDYLRKRGTEVIGYRKITVNMAFCDFGAVYADACRQILAEPDGQPNE